MNILQISTKDIGGGAEKIAYDLFTTYKKLGHRSWLAVGKLKRDDGSGVFCISDGTRKSAYKNALFRRRDWLREGGSRYPGAYRLSVLIDWLARPKKRWDLHWGIEDFNFPGSHNLLKGIPEKPEIIHAHNLHGNYFDLAYLPELSGAYPTVITLHDEWMSTGHCAYTSGCDRWEFGCGKCPDLTIYPGIRRDATAFNWRRKRRIYRKSKLNLATPSRWLLDRVRNSMMSFEDSRVILNGVDQEIFRLGPRDDIRKELNLPRDARVVLAFANWNKFKDYATIERTMESLGGIPLTAERKLVFVSIGGNQAEGTKYGNIFVRRIPFQPDPKKLSRYYQTADIFLHAAHVDNFPTTVIESLSCGTPVIATAVGGIPEQIQDGVTGYLIPPGDSDAMAGKIINLLEDTQLCSRMGVEAAQDARERFDLVRQVDEYLLWYQEILNNYND